MTQYEASHGKKPRGRGRWGFEVEVAHGDAYEAYEVWATGTLTEAKWSAIRQAKQRLGAGPTAAVLGIEVLP
jgi:hypothetical protein